MVVSGLRDQEKVEGMKEQIVALKAQIADFDEQIIGLKRMRRKQEELRESKQREYEKQDAKLRELRAKKAGLDTKNNHADLSTLDVLIRSDSKNAALKQEKQKQKEFKEGMYAEHIRCERGLGVVLKTDEKTIDAYRDSLQTEKEMKKIIADLRKMGIKVASFREQQEAIKTELAISDNQMENSTARAMQLMDEQARLYEELERTQTVLQERQQLRDLSSKGIDTVTSFDDQFSTRSLPAPLSRSSRDVDVAEKLQDAKQKLEQMEMQVLESNTTIRQKELKLTQLQKSMQMFEDLNSVFNDP